MPLGCASVRQAQLNLLCILLRRHAARIAALTTERVSWEDFKKQQKEAAGIEAAAAADEAEQMQKYRAQLDADRAAKLAKVCTFTGVRCVANACSISGAAFQ